MTKSHLASPKDEFKDAFMKDIQVSNISYKVNSKVILNNINLTVDTGESFALLGENGSGKSTLIDIMLDDIKPTSGSVRLFSTKNKFDRVGVLYDHLPLFMMLKVSESINYFASIYNLSYKTIREKYFDVFEIYKIQNQLIKELSQGEKKRVGILLAVMHNPRLLVLDEPFANLDPTIINRIWKVIANGYRTIFFTTHDWKEAEKQADKIGFIYNGEIIHEPQSPEEILSTLPAHKKINLEYFDGIIEKLKDYHYYIHDELITIFFDEKSNLLKTISDFTNNFSVKDVGLEDAYLFHINKQKV